MGSSTVPATVSASGIININNTTEATNTTDGSLQTDGGLSVAKVAVIGDDLDLLSNGAIMNIGDSQKFTITHQNSNNTITTSANHRLAFGDAGEYISGDGTDLKIVSSGDIDITTTLVDVSGELTTSGATSLATAGGSVDISKTGENTTIKGDLIVDGTLTLNQPATGDVNAKTLNVSEDGNFSQNVNISGNLNVNGNINAINADQIHVEDKLVILGSVASPTDITAANGGLLLKGNTDKVNLNGQVRRVGIQVRKLQTSNIRYYWCYRN